MYNFVFSEEQIAHIDIMRKIVCKRNDSQLRAIVPNEVLYQLEDFFHQFRQIISTNLNMAVKGNALIYDYDTVKNNAKLYLGHFIQVLKLSIMRGEINKEDQLLYGADIQGLILIIPNEETEIIAMGQRIIAAETHRIQKGGAPIYNPPAAKVKVFIDMLAEYHAFAGKVQKAMSDNKQEIEFITAKCNALYQKTKSVLNLFVTDLSDEQKAVLRMIVEPDTDRVHCMS